MATGYHYVSSAIADARAHPHFRYVVPGSTTDDAQDVYMTLRPNEKIDGEVHKHNEQRFYVLAGGGHATVGASFDRLLLGPSSRLTVRRGTYHEIVAGEHGMVLLTTYVPKAHAPDTVHRTKKDADADEKDHQYADGK